MYIEKPCQSSNANAKKSSHPEAKSQKKKNQYPAMQNPTALKS